MVDCTATQLSPASTSAATTTARDGCSPTTATAAAYRRVAPVTSRPAPHDAPRGGERGGPPGAGPPAPPRRPQRRQQGGAEERPPPQGGQHPAVPVGPEV